MENDYDEDGMYKLVKPKKGNGWNRVITPFGVLEGFRKRR